MRETESQSGFFSFSPLECLSFTGHRMLTAEERNRLAGQLSSALEEYYSRGKRVFLSGGALGFDTLAAEQVILLRRKHSDARLILVLPCRSQASRWTAADQKVYRRLLENADQIIYTSQDYFPGCMQKRNQFLVDHTDTCICYLKNCRGGTWNTVSYAYDQHRIIRNLATEQGV